MIFNGNYNLLLDICFGFVGHYINGYGYASQSNERLNVTLNGLVRDFGVVGSIHMTCVR